MTTYLSTNTEWENGEPYEPFSWWMAFAVIAVAYSLWSGYQFYFGSCEAIKQYWLLIQAPGRCI